MGYYIPFSLVVGDGGPPGGRNRKTNRFFRPPGRTIVLGTTGPTVNPTSGTASPHRQQGDTPAPLKAYRGAIRQPSCQWFLSVTETGTPKEFESVQARRRTAIQLARSRDPRRGGQEVGAIKIRKRTEVSSFSLACHVPVAWGQTGSHASSILRTKKRFERCQVSETRLAVGSTSASTRPYNVSLVISSLFWCPSNTTPSCCKAADSDNRQCIKAEDCFDEASVGPFDASPDAESHNRQYSLVTQATVWIRQWRTTLV